MTDQSMAAYCWDLEPSLIQLPAMMRKGSQAGRQAGRAHSTAVINGARAKEMGHTDRVEEDQREGGERVEKIKKREITG